MKDIFFLSVVTSSSCYSEDFVVSLTNALDKKHLKPAWTRNCWLPWIEDYCPVLTQSNSESCSICNVAFSSGAQGFMVIWLFNTFSYKKQHIIQVFIAVYLCKFTFWTHLWLEITRGGTLFDHVLVTSIQFLVSEVCSIAVQAEI